MPRWVCLPLNTPAFPGHTSVRRVFPSTAARLAFQTAPSLPRFRLSLLRACPVLRSLCVCPSCIRTISLCSRSVSGGMAIECTAIRGVLLLYPRGPRSGLGYVVPVHHHCMRPHASHSRAHRDFTAVRLIPDAFAVPVRLGDPGVVPCFRYPFCLDMSPSATPGSSTAAYTQFLRRQRWPSSRGKRLGTSNIPTIRFPWGGHFGALLRFTCVTTCRVVCPLADLTQHLCSANGDFYFRASDELVTLSSRRI